MAWLLRNVGVGRQSLARLNFPILHKTLRLASMAAPSSPGTILAWGLRGTISRLSGALAQSWHNPWGLRGTISRLSEAAPCWLQTL